MKISTYLEILEHDHGTLVGIDGDRLMHVSERPLPQTVRVALAGYAPQLVAYFKSGTDRALDLSAMSRNLKDLGLIRMPNGRWTASEGDDHAERLLAGLLEPPPPVIRRGTTVRVDAEEIRPGFYTWTEPLGVRAVPMFNGRRLLET